MRKIKALIDLDGAGKKGSDMIIKWRITHMCNWSCSYCVQKSRRDGTEKARLEREAEELPGIARDIKALIGRNGKKRVKLELIGGEPCLHDLKGILKEAVCPGLMRVQITTNLSRSREYYLELIDFLHASNTGISVTMSYHGEFISLDDYIGKALCIAEKADIYRCQETSVDGNSDEVAAFREACERNGLHYQIDHDNRSGLEGAAGRRSGKLTDAKSDRDLRYRVYFDDGTEKRFVSRFDMLSDPDIKDNTSDLKHVKTKGLWCNYGINYMYIDYDKCAVRTPERPECFGRSSIKDYITPELLPCPVTACSLCGHVCLYDSDMTGRIKELEDME